MSLPQHDRRRPETGRRLHPLPIRAMHWLNALAIVIMIGSGWEIYNDQPLFGWLRFPTLLTIGDDSQSFKVHGDGGFAGALQWHFAAMWLLVLNGLAYLAYGFATGRFRRMLVPIRARAVWTQILAALHLHLEHHDLRVYNAVQRLLYVGIILTVAAQALLGVVLWKPVQFSAFVAAFGGFQGVRLAHFVGMSAIVAFLLIHVALALIVPRTLLAMVSGGPRVDDTAGSDDDPTSAMLPQSGV